jgi:hypothetical protein
VWKGKAWREREAMRQKEPRYDRKANKDTQNTSA